MSKNTRVGENKTNNFGSKMVIETYNSYRDIWVKFIEHGNKVHTTYGKFIEGKVKNPYDRSVYGVGYIGEGKYKCSENNKKTKQYISWSSMLLRCYSEKNLNRNPTYKNCVVCEEWHNFQNFAKWYDENYYEIDGQQMNLDKDILIKGNKVYSPNACLFVPKNINNLFVKSNSSRGNLPIGVTWHRPSKKYTIQLSDCSGYFDSSDEAFMSYKNNKEMLIKEKAIKYKNFIPMDLYTAMLNYKVEITD